MLFYFNSCSTIAKYKVYAWFTPSGDTPYKIYKICE